MIAKVDTIWMDGEWIPWDQANVHVLTHTLHYGLGVFEGIRCYRRDDRRSAIFRLEEHVQRLFDSAHIAGLEIPYTPDAVRDACLDVVRKNQLDECYVRPIAFLGDGEMGLHATSNPVRVAVAAWRWGAYLGDEGLANGIRAKVSSFTRPAINSVMTKAKIVGHYVNSILAKHEVVAAGYQEAILLDPQGYVAECSGENIFLVRKGEVVTPHLGGSILGGITRNTVVQLAEELEIPIRERMISRDELYIADEVFVTGTAAEVTPVREVDDRQVGEGKRGPITQRLQERYFQVVRGPEELHTEWLAFV